MDDFVVKTCLPPNRSISGILLCCSQHISTKLLENLLDMSQNGKQSDWTQICNVFLPYLMSFSGFSCFFIVFVAKNCHVTSLIMHDLKKKIKLFSYVF